MARRAIKEVNWAELANRIPDSETKLFAAFKATAETFVRRMNEYPETAPKIDWEYYRKNISKPGLVDNFKKQYEALSVPYPEDKYTAAIEEARQQSAERAEKYCAKADIAIGKIKEQIDKLHRTLPLHEMTLEEYYEAHPDDAYNIDNPTAWPHSKADQPENEPPREHH